MVDVIAFKDGYERALQLDASDAAMTDAVYTHLGWKDIKRSRPQLFLGDREPSLFFSMTHGGGTDFLSVCFRSDLGSRRLQRLTARSPRIAASARLPAW